jgi:hypothetical protein
MRIRTEWGTWAVSSCPKVSLSASATKLVVAARAHRPGSQPQETALGCFDK